jgi:hypothetical protein
MKKDLYSRYCTWRTPINDHVMGHRDGVVSLMIHWDGIDTLMESEQERHDSFHSFSQLLQKLDQDYCVEFHFWRERDNSVIKEYLDHGQNMIRGQQLGQKVREEIAEHYEHFSWTNQVALVVSRRSTTVINPLKLLTQSVAMLDAMAQQDAAKRMLEDIRPILRYLPGATICSIDEYAARIQQSHHRKGFKRGHPVKLDYSFDLADQLIAQAPQLNKEHACIEVDGEATKVILLYMYPDVAAGFFRHFAINDVEMHVSHIIAPINTRRAIDRSSEQGIKDELSIGEKGVESAVKGIAHAKAFRQFVVEHNLSIFKNAFIIHLHGEPALIQEKSDRITDWVANYGGGGGEARNHADLQGHLYRVGLPGLGRYSKYMREDHTLQIAYMLPVDVFDRGVSNPESIRLGTNGQVVGFSILKHAVSHGFTVAMTGAGKGTDKATEIMETYPFGLDWYIMEMGNTERWVVEGFGGTYTEVDPEHTVVNPMISYDLSNPDAKEPLNVTLLSGTVNSLAFLLTGGKTDLSKISPHLQPAAEKALKSLYYVKNPKGDAPLLPDLLTALEKSDYASQEQADAAKFMGANLHSFLDSAVGRVFTRPDNLTLSKGICGVDLKPVEKASSELLKFYLTFISLKFSQLAFFSSDSPARVLMDELHKFVAVAPEIVGKLIIELSRMGRKDFASIDLVTQGLAEIRHIDPEVIDGSTLRSLLYRPGNWDEIGNILEVPTTPLSVWRSYPNPEKNNLNWRPGLRSIHGRYYDLLLKFPELVLDIATTSPNDLALKRKIQERIDNDVFERVNELRKMRERKVAA